MQTCLGVHLLSLVIRVLSLSSVGRDIFTDRHVFRQIRGRQGTFPVSTDSQLPSAGSNP